MTRHFLGVLFSRALHRKAKGNKKSKEIRAELGSGIKRGNTIRFSANTKSKEKGEQSSSGPNRHPFRKSPPSVCEDVVPREEVVPTVVDTDRKGMYLSVVSTPQHPVDLVPRQKLVNKALVHQTIMDLNLSEIKGALPLGGRTRFFRHNWGKKLLKIFKYSRP